MDAITPSPLTSAAPEAAFLPRVVPEGTKRALVIALLSREQGASLDDLTTATGWLPDTARAALTGLCQSGHAITHTRVEDNRTVYRLAAAEPESAEAAPEPEEV